MGWSSGTQLFDAMVTIALRHAPHINTDEGAVVPIPIRKSIIAEAYAAMDNSDWDTEDESRYFKSDLVHLMYDLGRIDREDYLWYTDPDNNF